MTSAPVIINESLRTRSVGEHMIKFSHLKVRYESLYQWFPNFFGLLPHASWATSIGPPNKNTPLALVFLHRLWLFSQPTVGTTAVYAYHTVKLVFFFSIFSKIVSFVFLSNPDSAHTLRGTCIFPKSSVAFLLLDGEEAQHEDCAGRMQSFAEVHRKAFVVCCIDIFSTNAAGFISSLQARFVPTSYQILVASEWGEVADVMVSAADSHSPSALADLNNSWKTFIEDSPSEDVVSAVLASLGLSSQESALLLDGCGSLGNMATKTAEEFLEFGLEEATAGRLVNYFRKDSYVSSA